MSKKAFDLDLPQVGYTGKNLTNQFESYNIKEVHFDFYNLIIKPLFLLLQVLKKM